VDDVISAAGVTSPGWASSDAAHPAAHPVKQVAGTWSEDLAGCGFVASIEPGVARALGLEGELASDVAVAVLDLDALLAAPPSPPTYQPLPKFPMVKVDVACVAPSEMPAAELGAMIEKAGKGAVRGLQLFDVFRGESLGEGKKSLAYHVVLQSDTKTLTDKDAQKFLGRLERSLEQQGAALRS
jgi:phenylalanyl-tRNA synthetase beta chain